MDLTREQENMIKDYVSSIREGKASIFAGAGLSIPSGAPSWKDLLRDIAYELELNVDKETDLISLAQYYINKRSKAQIGDLISSNFGNHLKCTINQQLIAQLPIDTIWTTNYDELLENAFKNEHKKIAVKRSVKDFSIVGTRNDATIYKMHGCVTQATDVIISKKDYERYNDTHSVYTTALKGDLVSRTFLFIGFSFEDPNLDYVLGRISFLMGENKPKHYFFVKELEKEVGESEEDFSYRRVRQKLKIDDLSSRYGIYAVMVKEYEDITTILKIINLKVRINNIFISGAIETFGILEEKCTHDFISSLASKLIEKNYKLVSGFGVGVGSDVIHGVLSKISSDPSMRLDDHLKVYPFPQTVATKDRKQVWQEYREHILEEVGINIILFGNKIIDGKCIISDGVIEEFEIACNRGIKIIPVGCTGDAAKHINDIVLNEPEKYYGNNEKLIGMIKSLNEYQLTQENINSIIDDIINII
ncbi:SIR2 family protein, partial [Listeria monocytogenes]|nr:SIR2 family protein [Listeria monocytogenes]